MTVSVFVEVAKDLGVLLSLLVGETDGDVSHIHTGLEAHCLEELLRPLLLLLGRIREDSTAMEGGGSLDQSPLYVFHVTIPEADLGYFEEGGQAYDRQS